MPVGKPEPPRTVAERHNNPLNLKYSPATSHWVDAGQAEQGEEATDGGRFLKFKTPEMGFQAARELLFGPNYSGLSVHDALQRWSNKGYGEEASGLAKGRKMSELTSDDQRTLVSSMARQEGFRGAIAGGFDIEAARKAGYSDDEILGHLTQTRRFDVQGALGAGYSKSDLIQYLSANSPVAERTSPVFPVQTPESTMLTRGRELALGVAEGLGIDPAHPLSSTVSGIIQGSTALPRMISHPREARQFISGALQQAPDLADQIYQHYNNGNYDEMANAVGKLIAFGGAVYGGGKALKRAGGVLAEGIGVMPPEPPPAGFGLKEPQIHPSVQQLTEAVGKTGKMFVEDRFRDVASKAFPDLKRYEIPALGREVNNLRDAARVAKFAKNEAFKPYQELLDSTEIPIERLDIQHRAIDALPDTIRNTRATTYGNIIQGWANDLSKPRYTAQEIENASQMLNAKLKAYYQKNNLDRAAASKLPKTAGDEALLAAYRDALDSTIKQATGQDAAPLRQRYGHLKAVENALIETPAGDDTLFDVMFRAPKFSMTKTGMLERVVTHAMRKEPNQLVTKAFRGHETPPPFEMPELPRPAGLLEAGPMITPPPGDVSGVTGTPAPVAPPSWTRALPPAPTRLGAPETSAVSGVPAVITHPPGRKALPPPSMRPTPPLSPSSQVEIEEFLKRNKPVDWRKAKTPTHRYNPSTNQIEELP